MSGLRKSPSPEEPIQLGKEVEYVYDQVCSTFSPLHSKGGESVTDLAILARGYRIVPHCNRIWRIGLSGI